LEVRKEVRKLSGAINALVDHAVQTGGVKSAGRVAGTPDKASVGEPRRITKNSMPDLNTIVSRLRLSLPIMRAA
jgi:hypothetical protein